MMLTRYSSFETKIGVVSICFSSTFFIKQRRHVRTEDIESFYKNTILTLYVVTSFLTF